MCVQTHTHTRTTTLWAHTYARPHTNIRNLRNWQPDNYLRCSVSHVGAPFVSSTYAHTCSYLITPCSRALLEKMTCSQLVKKFPAFYATRRFITAFTSARHLSLPWARSIQSMAPNPTVGRSISILTSHLRLGLPSGLFASVFPTKPLYKPLFSPKHAHAAHRRCCLQAASSVLYTTSCKYSPGLLRMGETIARNMFSWLKLLINCHCCIWLGIYIIVSMMHGHTNMKFLI